MGLDLSGNGSSETMYDSRVGWPQKTKRHYLKHIIIKHTHTLTTEVFGGNGGGRSTVNIGDTASEKTSWSKSRDGCLWHAGGSTSWTVWRVGTWPLWTEVWTLCGDAVCTPWAILCRGSSWALEPVPNHQSTNQSKISKQVSSKQAS